MVSAPEFDWANDESVVLHKQPAIAVYPNNMGTIVIRQERDWDQDEDTIIVTASLDGAEAVARAILREIAAVRRDLEQVAPPLIEDTTAVKAQQQGQPSIPEDVNGTLFSAASGHASASASRAA